MDAGKPIALGRRERGDCFSCSALDEPFEQPVNDRLIELAEIGAGYDVVDVATGIGDPALSVARRVGPDGRVIATDQSPAMLADRGEPRPRSPG